ncbi:HET domain protein [Dactylonectria macrodidyma]|uniref:HET domain protein n=1 Tax=Dactylonectria macrodidyma TaxID=307937 RepID=A0A9P9F761_9HYPO|nr:HET domain protein [Dactylonectria macrodidyma]
MRLINVNSMVLEEFIGGGSDVPNYAILSHTWEDGEVTFHDFINPDGNIRTGKKGFAKIDKTCELARHDSLAYAWVDTCCIDKSSSAELTEAINSMFQWYQASVVCYAWLADLPTSSVVNNEPDESTMSKCRWFTRGWTLQELVAPKCVNFYDQAWNFRGTKSTLNKSIASITMIDSNVLEDAGLLPTLSVAKRMSWAALRNTTRIEDIAYCLLGIFDVNMPMLYGEGTRAFLRLQEEIAKETNDLSLFAWKTDRSGTKYSGVFATKPAGFRESGSVELHSDTIFNPEFALANKGLRINIGLYSGVDESYLLNLNCTHKTVAGRQQIGIWIKPHGGGVYSRTRPSEFGVETPGEVAKSRDIFLFKWLSNSRAQGLERSHSKAFMLRQGFNTLDTLHSPEFPFTATTIMPQEEWDSQRRMFLTRGAADFSAYAFFAVRDSDRKSKNLAPGSMFLLAFGKTSSNEEPWATIMTPYDNMKAFTSILDVAKTIAAVRSCQPQLQVKMKDAMNRVSGKLSVRIENAVVEGQDVHCIDLSYGNEMDILTAGLLDDASAKGDDRHRATDALIDTVPLRQGPTGQRVRRNT